MILKNLQTYLWINRSMIIAEHGLVNGEVEISIEVIKECYQNRLKESQ